MLDIKFVRASPEIVKADLKKRNDTEKSPWVDDLLAKDARNRELIGHNNELRRRRNSISYDINRAKKAGEDASALMAEASNLPKQIKENETEMEELSAQIRNYLMRLPNILHESVPEGKDDTENVEIRKVGTPRV
ncbi:MAG: serine--tRNA ligase, partial [Methanobacteriota archaeon]